jgi:hypothetical protein
MYGKPDILFGGKIQKFFFLKLSGYKKNRCVLLQSHCVRDGDVPIAIGKPAAKGRMRGGRGLVVSR